MKCFIYLESGQPPISPFYMGRAMRKRVLVHMRAAKAKISLRISAGISHHVISSDH